jgi:flagellar basal body-associated protein FliL
LNNFSSGKDLTKFKNMKEIILIILLAFLLLIILILIYLLCCKCIIFDSYINSEALRLHRIRQSMEEEQRHEELREYIEMRRILMNYKNRYKVPEVEEMEDKEHVIIVNPDGAEICIGKVITDYIK